MKLPGVNRRQLLIGGGVGVGLVIAFNLWPRTTPAPQGWTGEDARFDHYLKIGSDGAVTALLPQVETGQGIWTTLAGLMAAELGIAHGDIALQPAVPGPGLENHALGAGLQVTAGSSSIRAFAGPVRDAAATARMLLAAEAAERFGAPLDEIDISEGAAHHGGRSLPFAELVEAAASRSAPRTLIYRAEVDGGVETPRLDTLAKAQGSWRLASDVRLPGLKYASVRIAPEFGAITSISRGAVTLPMVERENWVAAIGDDWWAAERAIAAAKIRFTSPGLDHEAIAKSIDNALDQGGGASLASNGDAQGALGAADQPLVVRYHCAPIPHAALDPMSATARRRADGGIDLWAASQAPAALIAAVAEATGLSPDAITLIPLPFGGHDGGALENEVAAIAATIAVETGGAVQLTLSPAHAARLDRVGAPMAARIRCTPSDDGRIGGWEARFAGMGGLGAALQRLGGDGPALDSDGAVPPYAIPDLTVEQAAADLPLRTGYRRGHAAMFHAFCNESMVDELARALGAEPLSFRVSMLGGDRRLAGLVQQAGLFGGWDSTRMGIACASLYGSAIALVAEAEPGGTAPRVTRLSAVVDCGRAIHPALVRQQVEAGLVAALQQLSRPAPAYRAAMPLQRAAAPGLARLPIIRVDVVESEAPPGGVSGLAEAVTAAAIANALVATGNPRLRSLPFAGQSGG
ncbi:molybdopterin cofactor-binding domain-containing protein [Sphingomicrobium flavum]|uniref:molybdopterin cofactor-binding domain-containing protein n=1 Tax=Sphingomicrobium flavum TaxID=1229164 RepID=UPI0021AE2484|nr:molybdopterin cofactor-binding domain-containing protein [Sphingomicrobium flavum]